LTGSQLLNSVARDGTNMAIGAVLGSVALGYYTLAYRLMLFPTEMIAQVLSRVLFPAFSKIQNDDGQLAAQYLRSCRVVAFVAFPIMASIFALAMPMVEVVLGEKWLPSVSIFMILAPAGMIRAIVPAAGVICLAKGRTDILLGLSFAGAVVTLAAMLLGSSWGLPGMAVGYTLATILLYFPRQWFATRLVKGLSLSIVTRALLRHLACSLLMAAVILLVRWGAEGSGYDHRIVLVVSGIAGAIAYVAITALVRSPEIDDLMRLTSMNDWQSKIRYLLRRTG
jgi:PST family polysaccharide transporter